MKQRHIRNTIAGLSIAGALALGAGAAAAQTTNPLPTPPPVTQPTNPSGLPTPPAGTPPTTPDHGQRGGPKGGRGGDRGKGAATTQQGSAHELNRAYRNMANYLALDGISAAPAASTQLLDIAKSSYGEGLTAYNAKTYAKAGALAASSDAATEAARHLFIAQQGKPAVTVPGVTAPPAADEASRATRELNHAYREIGRATAANSSNATATSLIRIASDAYTAALSDNTAKKYDTASLRANAAGDAARAALLYIESLSAS